MYKIIASDSNPRGGAILQKKNREFYFSSLWLPAREEWLQGFREGEIEVFVARDNFVPHNPPIKIEKLEDWPKTAAEYEEQWHKMRQENAVHAAAP